MEKPDAVLLLCRQLEDTFEETLEIIAIIMLLLCYYYA